MVVNRAQAFRWGILGPGWIAGTVAPAMAAAGHRLVAVGSRSPARAAAFAATHGVDRACSYEDVVQAQDVDAVYIALANDDHERWTIAALDAGKDVLCEKPLCLDAGGVGRVDAAATRTGGMVMEAVMTRFHPRTTALLEAIAARQIGQVRHVHVTFGLQMRDRGNYRAMPQHGGGALLDVGLYAVTAARWIIGEEPSSVGAHQCRWDGGVDAATSALLRFPGGATATFYASFDAAEEQRIDVIGSDGTLTVPYAFTCPPTQEAVLLRDGVVVGSWRTNQYQLMVEAFAAAALAGHPAPLPTADSLATAGVLDEVRSVASRQP